MKVKITKKLISLIMVTVMLFSIRMITNPIETSAAGVPVRLICANFTPSHSIAHVTGYIEVENIAYAKNVTVVFTTGGGTWQEVAATYDGPTQGNYERWKFSRSGGMSSFRFAIRYEVNGQTYWDNNNGNDYILEYNQNVYNTVVYGNDTKVLLENAYRDIDKISGSIIVDDRTQVKGVIIRYTTDNWVTFKEAHASYDGRLPNSNHDRFRFEIQTPATGELQFAIAYIINRETFWDNNDGKNYSCDVYSSVWYGK